MIALGLLALSASHQRGLENFISVHVHVENNWLQRIGSHSCGSSLWLWTSACRGLCTFLMLLLCTEPRAPGGKFSTATSHSGCQCPRRCQWGLKWCDLKSRKHEMCHFYLLCSPPWITREANEHGVANELQDLPFQRYWFLFSILSASTHHNKFRLGIETSSWKICLVLHNLHSDTSSEILVQGTPQSAAEI